MLSTCRRVGSASAVKTASAVVTSARCRCRGKIHAKLAKLALPTLGVALVLDAPQLRRQTCKARLDHPQSRALGVVIEDEFDSGEWPFGQRYRLVAAEGPLAEHKAVGSVDHLDHGRVGVAGAARAVRGFPGKRQSTLWAQVDFGGRAKPRAQLLGLGQGGPDTLGRSRDDELAFDAIENLFHCAPSWPAICNRTVAVSCLSELPCNR